MTKLRSSSTAFSSYTATLNKKALWISDISIEILNRCYLIEQDAYWDIEWHSSREVEGVGAETEEAFEEADVERLEVEGVVAEVRLPDTPS